MLTEKIEHNNLTGQGAIEGAWPVNFISAIGSVDFFSIIAKQLRRLLPHDFCMIFYYADKAPPVVLFDDLTPHGYGRGVKNYIGGTYCVNPFYRAFEQGLKPGVHSMSELVQSNGCRQRRLSQMKVELDTSEEMGFVTRGWPKHLSELMLAIPIGDGHAMEINISRQSTLGFDLENCFDKLNEFVAFIGAAVRKHFEFISMQKQSANWKNYAIKPPIDVTEKLSRRELEVVELMLTGHSSMAISLHLEIALPTVKSHRRNIFKKLSISSLAELFLLANKH